MSGSSKGKRPENSSREEHTSKLYIATTERAEGKRKKLFERVFKVHRRFTLSHDTILYKFMRGYFLLVA